MWENIESSKHLNNKTEQQREAYQVFKLAASHRGLLLKHRIGQNVEGCFNNTEHL